MIVVEKSKSFVYTQYHQDGRGNIKIKGLFFAPLRLCGEKTLETEVFRVRFGRPAASRPLFVRNGLS